MELIGLLHTALGGIIGIAASVIAPTVSSHLNEKSERKKQRTEKLGELIAIIYETDHWLSEQRSVLVFGAENTLGPNPLPKAIAISAIYFSQFNQLLAQYDLELSAFELWMIKAGQKRTADYKSDYTDGMEDAYRPYMEKRTEVISALKDFAKAEFGR